ncbi:hypothetical protein J2S13_000347 [Oikeobacillus pervagus]|uniref:Uncharacterized protein n=1 Tax=Oikeobacillus pervagus TaxID=1325931 RepID=A0AAJ1SZA5_9BACI|nr:hypothetical protein [Oikeobacillus pervagus]MDQ0213952.1 hypothetical protein [Oikeobacillus pervagus]
MTAKKPGNPLLPDFKQLDDRMIAQHTTEPTIVIKTNLDPKDVTEENPYFQQKATDEFHDYFEE